MNQKDLEHLILLLDDSDPEVFSHVRQKIASLGVEAFSFLQQSIPKASSLQHKERIRELLNRIHVEWVHQRLSDWFEGGGQDLLEGFWIINTYLYPEIDYSELKKNLEQLYYEIWLEFKYKMNPVEQVKLLNTIFFGSLRFAANNDDFHSPDNSMMHFVLEKRLGNPISLCVVYMMIAQKLKLPIYGVNLPNLFVLTYKTSDFQFYINVYNKGLIFTKSEIESYILGLKLPLLERYFEPCTNTDILLRVMRNLLITFRKYEDDTKSEQLSDFLNEFGIEDD